MNLAEGGRVADRRPIKQRPFVAPPEDDPLPAVPLDNPVRASADRQGRRITGEEGRVTPPGRLVDVTGNDREVEVPDVRGQRLPMEEDDRPLVVGLDGAELVGAIPDPCLRQVVIHDHGVAEGDVAGRDRRTVAPQKIVAEHDPIDEPVGAGLPGGDCLLHGKRLQPAVEGEQAEFRQPDNLELRRRAPHDRVEADRIDPEVADEDGPGIGLASGGEPGEGGDDPGVGRGGVVRCGQGALARLPGGKLAPQDRQAVLHRPIDPDSTVELGQGRGHEGDVAPLGQGPHRLPPPAIERQSRHSLRQRLGPPATTDHGQQGQHDPDRDACPS